MEKLNYVKLFQDEPELYYSMEKTILEYIKSERLYEYITAFVEKCGNPTNETLYKHIINRYYELLNEIKEKINETKVHTYQEWFY